jgi:hypothetical protein
VCGVTAVLLLFWSAGWGGGCVTAANVDLSMRLDHCSDQGSTGSNLPATVSGDQFQPSERTRPETQNKNALIEEKSRKLIGELPWPAGVPPCPQLPRNRRHVTGVTGQTNLTA